MGRSRHKKGLTPYILIVGIAIIVLVILKNSPFFNADWLETPISDDETPILFDIESGESGRTVAANLKNEGLVTSEWAFYWYLKQNDLGSNIQAGRFVLSENMSPSEIADAITSGSGEMAVTIPEGYTIAQIDDKLYDLGLIEDDAFKTCAETCTFDLDWAITSDYNSLEGYLFPDTYFVDPATFDSEIFLNRLLETFEQKVLTDENVATIEASGRSLDETIIAASIIEKEVISEKDQALVSGIIWKRYDNGWALGMCSTVTYLTGKTSVSYEDTEIDSPYNTYQYAGFPPTAISNPGLQAIEAAINPEGSPYWYFLTASDTGETIYATTNAEHETNKAMYID